MAKKANGNDNEKAKAEDFLLMPPTSTIKSLKIERTKALKTSRNATSAYGAEVAKAVEKKHVDKKALSMAFSLDDMPDEKLAITLPHLLRYIDDLKLHERAEAAQGMFRTDPESLNEGEAGEDDDGDGDDDGKRGSVTRIGDAARKVAERAGSH